MSNTANEAKALFDRIFWLRRSLERPDKDGYIFKGAPITPVPRERALELAKEWVDKMQEHMNIPDYALMEFDMKSALYWLSFALPPDLPRQNNPP